MIINIILIIIILILLSASLRCTFKKEGFDQVIQNKNDIKKLQQDYNKNSVIQQEVNNLEKLEKLLKKNIKAFTNKLNNIAYGTLNTTKEDAPNPPPQAPSYMYD